MERIFEFGNMQIIICIRDKAFNNMTDVFLHSESKKQRHPTHVDNYAKY